MMPRETSPRLILHGFWDSGQEAVCRMPCFGFRPALYNEINRTAFLEAPVAARTLLSEEVALRDLAPDRTSALKGFRPSGDVTSRSASTSVAQPNPNPSVKSESVSHPPVNPGLDNFTHIESCGEWRPILVDGDPSSFSRAGAMASLF